ncbi:hypothetical protein LEG54_11110 [Salmonella enterica]|nr:hypothetical protein [Salmonella enterica]MCQ7735320.1 hypothetical protein [Salmonella enterica]MCQ7739632.1 hypothetical protein [Salmonella enterica]MDJ9089322.1 hypothetical protein [Salmonella enterica]
MTALNKQALRNTADRDWFESWFKSDFHPDKTGPYIKDQLFFAIQAARKQLLDELEAAEERYEDMLRQARSFREAHDSAAEIIRKLERNKPTVTLPTTRLWAGKVAYYEECEIREILSAAGIGVKGE